ncbi:hypothetical protein T07_7546 [Trichinella nelsoni]|uniref:Uncharacterized protein n=1 Tax=Trichinella nelsoni TaxID=6336 RepID=A0A0V0RDM0_9BILA|nr:hypothetical protein T07_7546 [Trichinella nelsoni]
MIQIYSSILWQDLNIIMLETKASVDSDPAKSEKL